MNPPSPDQPSPEPDLIVSLRRHPRRGDALALLAGLLFPLSFAPLGWWPLAVLAMAMLLLAWWTASPGRGFWRGYLFGLASFGGGIHWLHISFGYSHVAMPIAVVLTTLFVLFMALYPGLAGWVGCRLRRGSTRAWFLLTMPALWVLVEWIRGWFLSGFPWLQAGYSQSGELAMGLAPITGVLGISGWLLVLAGVLALLAVNAGRYWKTLLAVVLPAVLLPWLSGQFTFTQPDGPERQVALVQGNIPQDLKWLPSWRGPTLDRYLALSKPHWGKDLMIWPETAIPAYRDAVQPFLDELGRAAEARGTDLLVGLPVREVGGDAYYNSVIAVGSQPGRYDKRHLVPFGEFLPLVDLLGPVVDFLRIPLSSFSSGAPRQAPLRAGGERIAVSICYEGVLGTQVGRDAADAGLLVNVSNDAWFGESIAAEQHLQMSRLRAAETGRYLLRATNTGISAIVDPGGRLLQRSPRFEAHVLAGRYRSMSGATPYMVTGDWPVVLLCLGLLLLAWRQPKNP